MTNYSHAEKSTSLCSKQSFPQSPVGKHKKRSTESRTTFYIFLALMVIVFLVDATLGDEIWANHLANHLDVSSSMEYLLFASALCLAICHYIYPSKCRKKGLAMSKSKSATNNLKVEARPKCAGKVASGAVASAQTQLFSSQRSRALLEQYAHSGDVEQALALFREMEQSGVQPDGITPNIVMRAFARKGDLAGAAQWLSEMKSRRMEVSACTYNTIIDACAKFDKPERCEQWLSRMTEDGVSPTAVTFATLISAYARRGNEEKAESLFGLMKKSGVSPDSVCYNSLIHACSMRGNTSGVARWIDEMQENGMELSVTTFTAAIDACAKRGKIEEAESWMNRMVAIGLQPNVVSYSSLMDACAKVGRPDRAGFWYDHMREAGITPNSYTFSAAIAACGKAGDVAAAEAWLARAQAANAEVASDPVLYSCTIDACAKVNDADRAWRVFEQMKACGVRPHIVTYATLARPFAQRGDYHKVEHIEELMMADSIPVNEYFLYAQLVAYGKARPRQEAKAVLAFKKGLTQGAKINERVLDALRRVVGRKTAIALHEEARQARTCSPETVADTSWLHSPSKH